MGKKQNMEWLAHCRETTKWLATAYPLVFSHPMRPLKIGITQDIIAANMDGTPDEQWIARAIGYHVRSHFYLRCMKQGACRLNIEGQPDGEVTEMEAASAKAMLIARQKKSAQKANQIKMERKAAKELAQVAIDTNDALKRIDTPIAPAIGAKKILTLKKKAALVLQEA